MLTIMSVLSVLGLVPRVFLRLLKDFRLLIKKTLNHPRADQEQRAIFCQKIEKYKQEGRSLVYIDESGFAHDMQRTHGHSLKSQRCYGTHDWGAKGRTNVIGALLGKMLLTVSLFNGSINTEVFTSWIKNDLMPKLPPQSIIIMDNASFHKDKVMQELLKYEGHTLEYLPTYSPDLNPIEHKWAQSKGLRRKIGGKISDLFKNTNI